MRETVQEILVPKYVDVAAAKPRLFANVSKDDLLGYGVPAELLDDVRNTDEDTLLELADHLPGEAAEALLNLATGGTPEVAKPAAAGGDPFAHPDAQRRFRVMNKASWRCIEQFFWYERIRTLGRCSRLYNTERRLLYVACTRARDQLLVTSVDPASEFLDDMRK